MMKKLILLALITLVSSSLIIGAQPNTKKFAFSIGAGMRSFRADLYKAVYPGTTMTYNIDLGFKVTEPLEVFLHTDLLKKDGKTTFTLEKTTIKIIPIEIGARYLVTIKSKSTRSEGKMSFNPYLGAGAGYYMIKEENPIGTLDEKRVGFFVELGLRLNIKTFFIDLKGKNVFLKTEGGQKLDGFAVMGGIGMVF